MNIIYSPQAKIGLCGFQKQKFNYRTDLKISHFAQIKDFLNIIHTTPIPNFYILSSDSTFEDIENLRRIYQTKGLGSAVNGPPLTDHNILQYSPLAITFNSFGQPYHLGGLVQSIDDTCNFDPHIELFLKETQKNKEKINSMIKTTYL